MQQTLAVEYTLLYTWWGRITSPGTKITFNMIDAGCYWNFLHFWYHDVLSELVTGLSMGSQPGGFPGRISGGIGKTDWQTQTVDNDDDIDT